MEALGNASHLLQRMREAHSLHTTVPETKGQSCLFLTYRLVTTLKNKQCLTFLSPHVRRRVEAWIEGRPLEERQELLIKIGKMGPGFELSTGSLFQSLCFEKWRVDRTIGLEMREFAEGPRINSRLEIDMKKPGNRHTIRVTKSCGLTERYLPSELPPDCFIYELHAHVGLPVVDALLLEDERAYLFQLTTSTTHTISHNEWNNLTPKIPRKFRGDVWYIMVNPMEFKDCPSPSPSLSNTVLKYQDWKEPPLDPPVKVRFFHGVADKVT